MIWFLQNWKIVSLVAGLTVLVFAYGIHRQSLIQSGRDQARQECNIEKLETLNENIGIKKKQDRVAPISGKRGLIDSLRDGSAL